MCHVLAADSAANIAQAVAGMIHQKGSPLSGLLSVLTADSMQSLSTSAVAQGRDDSLLIRLVHSILHSHVHDRGGGGGGGTIDRARESDGDHGARDSARGSALCMSTRGELFSHNTTRTATGRRQLGEQKERALITRLRSVESATHVERAKDGAGGHSVRHDSCWTTVIVRALAMQNTFSAAESRSQCLLI
jgi:hypothetical protein